MKTMNKRNKNINDLIDKGWNEMSNLLDERLPVPVKKSYGFRLKIAAILILLLVSASGVLYLSIQKEGKIGRAAKSINANIVQKTDINHLYDSKKDDQKSDEIIITDIKNRNLAYENNHLEIINKANDNNLVYVKNNTKYNNIVDNSPAIKSNITDIASEPLAVVLKDLNKNKIAIYLIPKIGLNTIVNSRLALKIKDFAPVVSMVKHKVKEGNSLSFGINAVSENLQSLGGAEFSFLYNYNLLGNIFLNSGLELSYLTKSKMGNSFFRTYNIKDPLLNFNTENLDIDSYLANFKSPVLRSIFIDKLVYIGIPFSISANTKNLNYSIGFKVAYLVSATNYTSNNEYHYGYNFVIKSPYSFYNSNVYNKMDYGLKIALGYNLTSKLSLNYYLNYSFSWIINSPNYQDIDLYPNALIIKYNEENRYDKNFYFGLGLKYRMK